MIHSFIRINQHANSRFLLLFQTLFPFPQVQWCAAARLSEPRPFENSWKKRNDVLSLGHRARTFDATAGHLKFRPKFSKSRASLDMGEGKLTYFPFSLWSLWSFLLITDGVITFFYAYCIVLLLKTSLFFFSSLSSLPNMLQAFACHLKM